MWSDACVLCSFSRVRLFAAPRTAACQAPLSMILQAIVLEWAAVLSSRGSSQLRDHTHVSYIYLHWQVGSLSLVPSGKAYVPNPRGKIKHEIRLRGGRS